MPHETGKVVTSVIETFKGNPTCLAVTVLAGIFAALTFYALQRSDQRSHDARIMLLERCFPLDRERN